MKIFVDTNVVVSSFTSNGLCRKLFELLVAEHDVVISPQVLTELRRTVLEKFVVNESELDAFIHTLEEVAEVSLPPYASRLEVRDPDDIPILGAAIQSRAEILVTGDKDLLDLPNPPLRILKPRAVFDLLTDP
ncbi:MAG: putative toxin-antitoxin system toxin component, PIN family [Candidatus Kapaibacterium sp.]